ncbi:MAG: Coat protein, partial [Mesorhizobium sp.]
FVPHVPGTRFLDASSAGEFATDAELALAANWDRTASSVKNMTFIALKTTEA